VPSSKNVLFFDYASLVHEVLAKGANDRYLIYFLSAFSADLLWCDTFAQVAKPVLRRVVIWYPEAKFMIRFWAAVTHH